MSAFIVSKSHIDRIVSTAYQWQMRQSFNPHRLGQMLWRENLKSVAHRYPRDTSGTRPGPAGLQDADIEQYQWHGTPSLTPLQALKAANCLDYQSCEHDDWYTSGAHAFLEEFKDEAVRRLPGYDAARWEWDG